MAICRRLKTQRSNSWALAASSAFRVRSSSCWRWWRPLRSTLFGRQVLSIGGNERAARLSGVPVAAVKRWVYAISGLCAGIAGLVVVSINSSSDANLVGLGMELDAIAAVAVGGTPFT